MSENTSRRSSSSSSDWDVGHSATPECDRESCTGIGYGARPALESSIHSNVRGIKRSRCTGHPSKKLSDATIKQEPGLLARRRIGASSGQQEALARRSGPCRKCYEARDRTETASVTLRRILKHRSPDHIITILRTIQIIVAARRPLTLSELDVAVNTRLPSLHCLPNGAKDAEDVQGDRADDKVNFMGLCKDLLKIDSNGVVNFCHKDMRNIISSVEFRRQFGLPQEDEVLAAISIQHFGCREDASDDMASTKAFWCPVVEDEACVLRDYAVSFWKEHYLKIRGGSQLVHSFLHESIVSSLAKGPSEVRCQRGCNDVFATGLEMAATHDLLVVGRAYSEMGAEVRQCNHSTHTPLHTAAANASTDMIRFLLECGADPNGFANDALESRRRPCSANDAAVSIALALRSPEHKQCHCWRCCNCFSGRTPLHLATATGQEESMKLLVAGGADINLSTRRHGDTALHLATKSGRLSVVQFLVASGAEIGRQNSIGATALQFAKTGHHYLIAKLLIAVAPPVVIEPAIDAVYVEAAHDRDQSTSPVWRMHSLSLEDKPPRISISSSKAVRDATYPTKFGPTDSEMCPNNKEPLAREESWILVEFPDNAMQDSR
jgi:ankyrin repeat protein